MVNSLEVMCIPTASRWLILPKDLVRNIYPYAPSLKNEQSSEFVIGSLLINNEIIPLVDLDFDHKRDELDSNEGFRIVMIDSVSSQAKYRHYALLAYQEPKALTLQADKIKTINSGDHRYIAQQVAIENEQWLDKFCYIPNLLNFESELTMS